MDAEFARAMRYCWYAVLLAVCGGCWQEVHYDPNKPLVLTPVVNDLPRGTSELADNGSDIENPLSAEQDEELAEVTADELFGTPNEATSEKDVAAETEAADISIEVPSAGDHVAPQDPPDSVPELAVEQSRALEGGDSLAATGDTLPSLTTTDEAPPVLRPSRTALAVWRMSSRWSFAAAVYAKGQPEERYLDSLEQATYAAELIGAELPSLPASEGMALEPAVIAYLLDSGPAAFANMLNQEYVPEYEALATLALRTNALLLVYTPKSQQLDPLILSIRQSAEESGLPGKLWVELVSMLERREPFDAVKQRVLSFHSEVADYLAGQE